MCFKKKKNKVNKIKPRGASKFAGSFSTFAGVLALIFTIALFVFYFIWGDSFTATMSRMDDGLKVLLIPFIAIGFIFWILIKLVFGSVVLSYMIISIILFFVAGGLMKKAGANLGNIYSNKANKTRAISSMVIWIFVVGFQMLGLFLTNKLSDPLSHNPQTFKVTSYINIGIFTFFALLCFVVTLVDFIKKVKQVKYNAQGQMIDETIPSTIPAGNYNALNNSTSVPQNDTRENTTDVQQKSNQNENNQDTNQNDN